jgi:hypothetical protein
MRYDQQISQNMDPQGYFRFFNHLVNMYADYLREPVPEFKNLHERGRALYDFELTVIFINPYSTKEKLLKRAMDILSEIADTDGSQSEIWSCESDVRLAKLNILCYQNPLFVFLEQDLQNGVTRLIRENFPSVLDNPPGERSNNIDPLLERMFQAGFQM